MTFIKLHFNLLCSLCSSSSQLTCVLYVLKQWLLTAWHTQTHQFKSTYKISLQSNGLSCHVNAAILGHLSIHNIPKGKILCIYTLMVSHLSQKGVILYVICIILYVCSLLLYMHSFTIECHWWNETEVQTTNKDLCISGVKIEWTIDLKRILYIISATLYNQVSVVTNMN